MLKVITGFSLTVCLAAVGRMNGAQPPAQAGAVTLPVLSFIPDNAYGIRPLFGIPGSASIGAAMNLGFDVVRAEIPSGNDYILAMTRDSNWPLLLQLRGDGIAIRPTGSFVTQRQRRRPDCFRRETAECSLEPADLGQPSAKIDRIVLSPAGSAAAFFSESQGHVYAFANLPQSPTLTGEFDVGRLGSLSSFGISDDGRTIALGVSDGTTGSLFFLNVDHDRTGRFIAAMRHPSVIAFLRNSSNAIIADDAENAIYALSDGQVFTIATAEQRISGPVGIAVSNDNQRVFVGNSASGSVTTIGPNGTVVETGPCNCTLTGLHSTNVDSVFRLTDLSGGPVLLFDASAAEPRIIFVPRGSL